jgi:hypothetical protein
MPMPFNLWMLLITTGWHARARLHPLLLACAFLAFASTHEVYAADVTPSPAATPEAAVRLFYPWYLGEMMKGRVPLTEERMQDYVAEDTLRDIAFMMKRPNGGKQGLQEDYFLQAKDYFDDWADHIAVSEVTIDGDTASALVALGDPAQGTKRLALTLVREQGGWKISRVNEAAASK